MEGLDLMDPNTGNIYTAEEADTLGVDGNELIPLEDDDAARLLEERRVHAEILAEKRRAATQKRRDNDAETRSHTESRNKRHVRAKNKAARTARRGNR